jgi:hypothetical protein
MGALTQKYGKQGLQVLGLCLEEDSDKVLKEYVRSVQASYPMALASDDVSTEYGLRSVPTLFLIGKKGIVAEKYMGFNDETVKRLEKIIPQLLAE